MALSRRFFFKVVPTEAHDRINIVERSHGYLRTVCEELRPDLFHLRKEHRLPMSFRAIIDAPC